MINFVQYIPIEFSDNPNVTCYKDFEQMLDNHDTIFEVFNDIDITKPDVENLEDTSDFFITENETQNLQYGDFYILGLTWVKTATTVLIGATLKLLPVVHASKPPPSPERPPKMKFHDLPIYQSPHYEYKEYLNDKEKCAASNTRILREALLPYVKQYRKQAQSEMQKYRSKFQSTCKDVCDSIQSMKKDVKQYARDPKNLALRQGLVTGGAISGFLMGSTLPKKFFYTGLGGLAAGALCFPDETDEFFRSFIYHSAKKLIEIYNLYCNKDFVMRERVPCSSDMPADPPKRESKCPQPKK